MKKAISLSVIIIVILLFSAVLCSAASTSQALSTDEVLDIINSSDPMGLNPPYEYDKDSKEYIEPIQRSLTLRENILYLPGKNGLDVNLNCTYNNHDSSVSFTKEDSFYERAFDFPTYCYSYTDEDGDVKNIYILFDTEDVMIEKAPLSFTAEEVPTAKTDDYGDKYYKYTSFDLADEGLTFTRRVDLKPFPIEISKSTKINESEINTFRLKVGDLWKWELPTVFSKINPSRTDKDEDTYYYDLYTAFTDIDNEYWTLHFAYDEDRDNDEITYTNIKPQNTNFLTWYDSVSGDIYDEEKGISYCCRIQDTKGRTMYFNYNGLISAVEDRFGNMIKYTFENNLLTRIEDTVGRIVSLTYDDGQVSIYVDYDGNGPEDAKLHTKMLYSSENNNELDPNNYLIADDSYVSEIVRFEDDNTEYTYTYDYKKGYAYSYMSGANTYNIQTPCSIVTKITHPNNLTTEYSYVRSSKSGYIPRNDFRISKRTDIDNNEKKNEISYASRITYSGSVATRTADDQTTTYSGSDVITGKTIAYDDVEFYEKYEYTTVKKKKRKAITQKYTKGSTSSAEREISTPITNYLPKGISYDDYSQTITYYDDSSFIETEIYNQSEDVFVKTTYTLSEEGDDFYQGRTIDSMTVSESTDGGDTYNDKYTVEYTYNPDGTLLSETVDPDGINQVTTYGYTYSSDGSITTTSTRTNLKDADGNSLPDITTSSKVDALGRLIWTEDGNGNETTYEYDGIGRLLKVTNPDDTTIEYEYDILNRTTTVTDENGIMQKTKYDGLGNILATYKNVGTVSTPRWVVVAEYEYDALCRPVVYAQYTGYTSRNVPTKWLETHYTYGAFDHVSEIAVYDETETELSKKTYTYNFLDRIKVNASALNPHEKANGGSSRKFTSVLVESAEKDGITPPTVKQYLDRQGRLCEQITTDGDNEYLLTYTYDALGNVLEIKDESAYADYDVDYSQKYEYNYLNKVVKAYNAEGNYTENTYDVLGRQLSSTDYMGNTATYTYDSIGRTLTASSPVDDGVNSLISYYYDSNSNVVKEVKAAAAGDVAYTYSYDNRNRLISSFNGSTYAVNEYDGNQLVKTVSGLTYLTTDVSELTPLNSTYNVTDFTYDEYGNITTETTFNGTTTYTYDLAGNTLTTTDPNGLTTYNTYDSRNNIVESVVAGDVIEYEYNSFNLITEASRNNVATTYTYDNFGRNITETTGTKVLTRTYSTAGQVATMSLKEGDNVLQSAEYEYNVLGNMTSAFDGTDNVVYTYNENGFPVREEKSGLITEYEYTTGNLMKSTSHSRRWINDPTDEEGYNTTFDISSFAYTYYPDGNVKTVSDTRGTTTYDTVYGYDAANRLIIANTTNNGARVRTWGYSYNNRGDRTSQTVTDSANVSTATIYTYTNHHLTKEYTTDSVTTYTYDANGNTLSKSTGDVTTQYTYTPRNEVASVTTNGTTYSYTYNASSLRTGKTSNGVTTSFIWAGDNIIREETPDKTTDYFYGVNRVSRTVKGDAYTYNISKPTYDEEGNRVVTTIPVNGYHEFYAYDGRGNVVHTTAIDSVDLYLSPFYNSAAPFPEMDLNCDGEFDFMDLNTASVKYPVVQNYYYSPFGEIWQGERSTDTNPFRYAGEYLDNETGDIYLRARYYDPSIGRFISVDPIKDGTNWYVYCSNNPIAFVDPSGLDPFDPFDSRDAAAEDFGKYIAEQSFAEDEEYAACIYEAQDNNGNTFYYYDDPRNELPTHEERQISFWITWGDYGDPVAITHTHGAYDANTSNTKDGFSNANNVLSGDPELSDTYNSDEIGLDYYLVTPNGNLKLYIANSGNAEGVLISSNMPVDPRIEIHRQMQNTLLWGLLLSNFPNATAQDIVNAKMQNPDSLVELVNSLEWAR